MNGLKGFLASVLTFLGVRALTSEARASAPAARASSPQAEPPAAAPSPAGPLSRADILRIVEEELARVGYPFAPAEIMAIIEIESSFRPDVVSWAGAIGLMQLMMPSARDRGYRGDREGLFDPRTNIRIGIAHLKWTRDFVAQSTGLNGANWVSAYNMGVGNHERGKFNVAYVDKYRAALGYWSERV